MFSSSLTDLIVDAHVGTYMTGELHIPIYSHYSREDLGLHFAVHKLSSEDGW